MVILRKALIAAAGVLLLATSGASFYASRNMKEPVVLGRGVTSVRRLGDYFAPIKGGINDANLYYLESGQPGATLLVLGGSHPEEPAGRLLPWILVENAAMTKGRLIVALRLVLNATIRRPFVIAAFSTRIHGNSRPAGSSGCEPPSTSSVAPGWPLSRKYRFASLMPPLIPAK